MSDSKRPLLPAPPDAASIETSAFSFLKLIQVRRMMKKLVSQTVGGRDNITQSFRPRLLKGDLRERGIR